MAMMKGQALSCHNFGLTADTIFRAFLVYIFMSLAVYILVSLVGDRIWIL